MTHDKLLARLNRPLELDSTIGEEWQQTVNELFKQVKALRAVVELHKPFNGMCDACSIRGQFIPATYPCRTIQAIEMELA